MSDEQIAAMTAATSNSAGLPTQWQTTSIAPNLGGGQFFTGDDLNKAREQEKQKLYPQMEKMREELEEQRRISAELLAKEEEREARRVAKEAERIEKQKQKEAEELSFKELLLKKEEELTARIESERAERLRTQELLEMERKFQDLQAFRFQRLEQERDNIIPELIDLIEGSSQDEIEQSIAVLKDKSARILNSAQEAMTSARQQMVGTRITMPASGPLDNDPAHTPTPDKNLSMADYIKNRDRYLGNANPRGQGLFS
jgi:hypothetical protein